MLLNLLVLMGLAFQTAYAKGPDTQRHYELLKKDPKFTSILAEQAGSGYVPIIFQKTDTKFSCNCSQYMLFFKNNETTQVRISTVLITEHPGSPQNDIEINPVSPDVPDHVLGPEAKKFILGVDQLLFD